MTSLSNVIKRGRATAFEPQRIDSKSLFEVAEQSSEVDHESVIAARYQKLRQEEEAANERFLASQQALEQLKAETLEAAYNEGHAAGFNEGHREGKAAFDELTTRLNTVLVELEQLYDEKWRSAEHQLVELAVEVAAKLTTDLIRKDEQLFADLIRTQVIREPDAESLTIYVHPTRLASIQRFKSMWQTEMTPLMKYRADASLDEVSVRIETPEHGSERDVSYSLERIRSTIEEVLTDGAY
ncbi:MULTISPECIES: FliH/SctL family protein [Exiguobacterium]|uniref:FliH/SctL family protein n=1 Tax=Exiguobacterium TaxID=33986 RepID=UPI001BE9EFF0|nr:MULTISPECIES: FliH/SctL family protein [Exiguobacterium]MCT4782897.1 FliH/SctL family protein [Exiguobacterium himgiriensis]